MFSILLALLGLSVFVVVVIGVSVASQRHARALFPPEERAFDERIRPRDRKQLERLGPLVHEVRVTRVTPTGQGRNAPEADQYHIFVIDTVGAIHDVHATRDFGQAQAIARQVAAGLSAELVDEQGLLR